MKRRIAKWLRGSVFPEYDPNYIMPVTRSKVQEFRLKNPPKALIDAWTLPGKNPRAHEQAKVNLNEVCAELYEAIDLYVHNELAGGSQASERDLFIIARTWAYLITPTRNNIHQTMPLLSVALDNIIRDFVSNHEKES